MALLHQLPTEILLIITDSFVTFQDLYSLYVPAVDSASSSSTAIAGRFKLGDLNSFVRTNRYLHKQSNGNLYKRAVAIGTVGSPAAVPSPVFDRIITSAFRDCPPSSTELFLDHGLDINTRLPNVYGGRGPNLLCIAVFYYREALVSLLISRGADVNADAYHGSTLLYIAMLGIRGHGALFSTLPINQRADLSGFDAYENRKAWIPGVLQS
ncbi:hypothetical protein BDD12DRAFT_880364 [Trichophaea hybrida]|nr:hypothetical protein BDD12DRAFT_880364 [Trichophaea hybrida]